MRKRIRAAGLILCLLLSLLPGTALADEGESEGEEPAAPTKGTCGAEGAEVTWKFEEDESGAAVLVIRGTGAMADYGASDSGTENQAPWTANAEILSKVTAITMEKGVTAIGDNAFSSLTNLVEISIPDTVTRIGADVFLNCDSLKTIHYAGTETDWKKIEIHDSNSAVIDKTDISWSYLVAFDTQGGEAISDRLVEANQPYGTLPEPERKGYDFAGWYTAAEDGDPVDGETTVTKNHTLYAHWEILTYTITYNGLEGAAADPSNPTEYTVETGDITLVNPTKEGFAFLGWSGTGLTGEENLTVTIPKSSTGNREYAAHWAKEAPLTIKVPGFDPVVYGYAAPEAKEITVKNDSQSPVTVTVTLEDGQGAFLLEQKKSPDVPEEDGGIVLTIPEGGSDQSLTVRPKAGLDAGTYSARLCFTCDDDSKSLKNLEFTVNRASQEPPAAPELDSKTTDSITLKSIADSPAGTKAQYRMKGGEWQDSPEFTGLTPGTEYTFEARYSGNDNYAPSAPSKEVQISTEGTANPGPDPDPGPGTDPDPDPGPGPDPEPGPVTYTLTVNNGALAGGGTHGSFALGDRVSITADEPAAGYVFDRWVSNGGGSFDNAAAASTRFTMPGQDVTITVLYKTKPEDPSEPPEEDPGEQPEDPEPAAYTITLNANGGTLAGGTQSVTTGADGKLSALPASPTRSGYRFTGWFTAASGGTSVSTSTVFTADATLYAHWEEEEALPLYYGIQLIRTSHGSISVSATRAKEGEQVRIYVYPDSGYFLDSLLVTDSRGRSVRLTSGSSGRWTFAMPASGVDVEAVFARTGSNWSISSSGSGWTFTDSSVNAAVPQITIQTVPKAYASGQTFYDVSSGHWAAGEIAWAYQNGYMSGTGGGAFRPEDSMNYQQLWMVIARMLGSTPANVSEANLWAVRNGFSGGGAPTSTITRQEMVTALYRAAFLLGGSTSSRASLTGFPDYRQVSAGAKDAMGWAVASGILGGNANGRLDPAGTVTRAQFAVILYRFSQRTVYR